MAKCEDKYQYLPYYRRQAAITTAKNAFQGSINDDDLSEVKECVLSTIANYSAKEFIYSSIRLEILTLEIFTVVS